MLVTIDNNMDNLTDTNSCTNSTITLSTAVPTTKSLPQPRKRRRYNEAAKLNAPRQLNCVGMSVRLFSGCIGLLNLGNSCYINSVIQALAYADIFRSQYIAYDMWMRYKNNTSNQTQQTSLPCQLSSTAAIPLSEQLHVMYHSMWCNKPIDPVYEPREFFYTVWSLYDRFAGYRQQDAHEFTVFLLSQLSKEYMMYNKLQSTHTNTNIEQMFNGQLRNVMQCSSGHISSTDVNYTGILSLHLPPYSYIHGNNNNNSSPKLLGGDIKHRPLNSGRNRRNNNTYAHKLELCLTYMYNNTEQLGGDNKFMCDSCQKHVNATRKTIITKLPEQYLILHIVRTVFDSATKLTRKDQSHVDFPIDGLDMTPYISTTDDNTQSYLYDLISVVSHHGRTVHEGHYDTYAWNEQHVSWLHYNDSSVSLANENDVSNAQPYLLFYKRRQTITHNDINNNIQLTSHAMSHNNHSSPKQLTITTPTRSNPRLALQHDKQVEHISLS